MKIDAKAVLQTSITDAIEKHNEAEKKMGQPALDYMQSGRLSEHIMNEISKYIETDKKA